MVNESVEETINQVMEKCNLSHEEIEDELNIYLYEKYIIGPQQMLSDAIVQQAKELIVSRLYGSTNCEISEGWNNYATIPSYKTLLRMMLTPAQRLFFDQIIQELLTEDLIYTKTFAGDKEAKAVGLTVKGILFKAEVDLF